VRLARLLQKIFVIQVRLPLKKIRLLQMIFQ